MLLQLPPAQGVRGQLHTKLRRRSGKDIGQGLVLTAHRPPVIPKAGLILPAVAQGGKLLIGGLEKGGKNQTAACKPGREISRLPLPPLHHGGKGVIQSVVSADIVMLPTGVAQSAAAAYPLCGAVKDGGGVLVIRLPGREGGAEAVPDPAEGTGGGLQPLSGIAGQPGHPLLPAGADQRRECRKEPAGKQQKQDRGQKHFIKAGDIGAKLPAPENGHGVGHGEGDGPKEPPLPPSRSGEKTGKAVGHGVKAAAPRRQVHAKAHRHTGGGPQPQTSAMGQRQHAENPQRPSKGQPFQNGDTR